MSLDRELVIEALPNYEVGDEVGRGGWAVVLHARHRILDREVAVKQLPVAFGADPVVRARFVEEARVVARLDHPHITPVYDFVEKDGVCLIVMEFLSGGSLWERFEDHGVRVDEACGYMLVASSALDHAHGYGVLHRDIKPENFLFDDRPGVIKLSDFGIAKVLGSAAPDLTAAGQIIGTPAYMAPEQITGAAVSPATDVYACGTMLYELLTGQLPFGESPDAIGQLAVKVSKAPCPILDLQPDVHKAVAAVVMRAIATDPGDRFATAHDFGDALARAATEAFGVSWLRRSGVQLDAAGHLFGITERGVAPDTRKVEVHHMVKATMAHPRLGDMIDEARTGAVSDELRRSFPPEVRPSHGSDAAHRPADVSDLAGAVRRTSHPADSPSRPPQPGGAIPAETQPAPAGWFADPLGRYEMRYWDGDQWTDYASRLGVTVFDPLA